MTRRFITIIIGVIITGSLSAAQTIEDKCTKLFFRDQGLNREFYLYMPDNLKKDAPLVLVLHGYGGSALKGKTRLIELADEHGFAICYAQGIKDQKGKTFWNVGYPFHAGVKTNDVKYLCRLVRHLQSKFDLSASNTFLTGMSNGGEMCYLMAMQRPGVFKAIASIAGLTLVDMDRTYNKPVPFMEVHGTKDKTSMWQGDPQNSGGWGAYQAVPVSVSYLIAADKCVYEVTDTLPRMRNQVILHQYKGGVPAWKDGPECEVWLYEVQEGGHSWAEKDMDTCAEIWKFFSKYLN